MTIDAATFAGQRSPRFGTCNPTRMDLAFWQHMVRTGEAAYFASRQFDPDLALADEGPVWSFDRFGPTRTPLPDGRVVCIGGEHEDHYDPDFNIYNDVIVIGRGGDEITIYGYPKEVFPPTDFHTATLFHEHILIVGGLGYFKERGGEQTPVFRLDLNTFEITRLASSGRSPGWIYGHRAQLMEGGALLRVWGGKVIDGTGQGEKYRALEGAADLVLADLAWRPAVVPPDVDAVPEMNWPANWEPLDEGGADYALNCLRREAPLGHPLFAANVRPWASGRPATGYEFTLFKLLDGSGRLAVVRLEGYPAHRAKLPEPETRFFDSLDEWLLAAGTSSEAG